MNNNTYIVTGGLGFIGSHLVESLLINNHKVIAIDDLSSGYRKNLKLVHSHKNLKIITKKVQNCDFKKIKNVKGIFHLAAQTSVQQSITETYQSSSNNFISSLKIFEFARNSKIPVVYASSSSIYGNLRVGSDEKMSFNLISPYAFDKLSLEFKAQTYYNTFNISSLGLRFFNVYGPRQDPLNPYSGVISIFVNQLLNSENIKIYGGEQTRDFIYVKDIIMCLISAMKKVQNSVMCDVINIGTGKQNSVNKLLVTLCKKIPNKSKILRLGYLKGDPKISNGSFKKINKLLNLNKNNFTTFDKGLSETVNHFKSAKK